MQKLSFIGVGKMGSSILHGAVKSGIVRYEDIGFYTTNLQHREQYAALGCTCFASVTELYEHSESVVLSIKPQMYDSALLPARELDFAGKCIISLAPGITIGYLEQFFRRASLVRVMPNTPAMIACAATTFASNAQNELVERAKALFDAIGYTMRVDEALIDEAIPVNGSMPAYLFAFAREFIRNGVERGLDPTEARRLCAQAILGSARLMMESRESLDTLIDNVCSKKGTTIEGLEAMYAQGFAQSIDACYDACVRRAKELSK